ncbi:MAG TPA: VOC family protein [Solirubrobacterales bacterium]|nr:VOC family protein [Solirubrobacterales bacterium]
MQKITPFLWFDDQAEEAMNFYTSVFKDSRVIGISRYGEAGPGEAGTVMIATFELEGQRFTALNGGPRFKFTEAISFEVDCETQEEVDYLWESLTAGGGEESMCGWLRDKYGLSWQVVPRVLGELMGDEDREKVKRVTEAMLSMRKIEIAELQRAYDG